MPKIVFVGRMWPIQRQRGKNSEKKCKIQKLKFHKPEKNISPHSPKQTSKSRGQAGAGQGSSPSSAL